MSDTDAELNRQEQIWAGLYGPQRALELVEQARTKIAADPNGDVRAILQSLEPADEFDTDEAGTMRPI